MSTQAIQVRPAHRRATPAGLATFGRAIWRSLERAGHRRAASELRRLAAHFELTDPALAAQLREASRFNPD